MDINTSFVANYSEYFTESRMAAARPYAYGNASFAAAMIATVAAGIRRAAATIERWAKGANTDIIEYRLPRTRSVR